MPKDLVTNKSVIQIKNQDIFGKKDFKATNVANMENMKLFMAANWLRTLRKSSIESAAILGTIFGYKIQPKLYFRRISTYLMQLKGKKYSYTTYKPISLVVMVWNRTSMVIKTENYH